MTCVDITSHVSLHEGGGGMKVRVFENSHVLCAEQPLTAAQATKMAVRLLAWAHPIAGVVDAHVWPDYWPPQHGDIWQDRHGARWSCQADLTLARLGNPPADDTANEIERSYGPMTLVSRPEPHEVECPF